jgi:putative ABC transport system permease protein
VWHASLPTKTPNTFIINISPEDVPNLKKALTDHGLTDAHFYPTIRGRIIAINGKAVSENDYPNGKIPESLTRTLNLSYGAELPVDNSVIAGRWWEPQDTSQPFISLESGMATSLGVKLGDRLTFSIAEKSIEAKIVSIRALHWEDFQPNFYVIFPPKTLDGFQSSVMTSLFVPPHSDLFLNQLREQFPDLTFLAVDFILNKVREIYGQAVLAINFLSVFIWVLCAQSLMTSLMITERERQYDGMVLRALGMSSKQFRGAMLLEFLMTGLIASSLGVIAATLLQKGLVTLTKIPIGFNTTALFAAVIFACGIHALFALIGQRKILKASPAGLLRGSDWS